MATADLDPPPRVFCYRSYYADLLDKTAFLFRVCETGTRFSIYTDTPDRYTIGHTYLLAFTPEARPTLPGDQPSSEKDS